MMSNPQPEFRKIRNLHFLLLLVGLLLMLNAHGHEIGQSYLLLNMSENKCDGQLEVNMVDLNRSLKIDMDKDGKISASEIDSNIEIIQAYFLNGISIRDKETVYDLKFTGREIEKLKQGKYVRFNFVIDNYPGLTEALDINYSILFDADPNHRGMFFLADYETNPHVAIFSKKRQHQTVPLTASYKSRIFVEFIGHGIWHIWIGIDHILFLIALILISVVVRKDKRWRPVTNFRPAFINILKIVTIFTIAHSITLTLAALHVVNLSPRLVESVIAVSVVAAGVNNIFPFFLHRIWWIIFAFGLFHGFGFASVLSELGLQQGSLVLALLGFNLGVEIGQIVIICISFPLCYFLRKVAFYPKFVLNWGSAMISLIALKWFIERAFDLT